MHRQLSVAFAAGLAIAYAAPAQASEPDFGYVYTTDIEEPGETEATLWATDRRGKDAGHYDAQEYRLADVRGLAGEFELVDRDFGFQGVSAEFKYRLLDPKNDHFGLALYAEPGWSRISKVTGEKPREFELELKAILQRNFAYDRLVWATNLTVEPEWEREHEQIAPGIIERETEKELVFEIASGLSYRVADNWWLGVEGRYHSVYPDWTHGLHRENYAVYAGPTVHFTSGEWSITATWLPQLFGSPSRAGSTLELHDHEKRELRLKISREF